MWASSLVLISALILDCFHGKKVKNFRVSSEITTGWTFCRSQALYISEFLYNNDQETFWKYFTDLNNKKFIKKVEKTSKQDQSHLLSDIVTYKKTSESARLLKLNLEMETFAPKFEAIAQEQAKILPDKCKRLWIEYQNGLFACSIDELDGKAVTGVKYKPYDYVKTINSRSDSAMVRIYTIAGSKWFNSIFNELVLRGFNVAVQLVPRPQNCPFYQEEVLPTGYGLEFELKSSQYVVEEAQAELFDDQSDEPISKSLKQQETETLKSFKEITDIENIQGRALKNILKSSSFDEILETSANLPLISEKMKKIDFDPTSHQQSQQQIQSHFRINDLDLKSANIDPFRLLDFVNIFFKINNEITKTLKHQIGLKKIFKSRLIPSEFKTRFNIQSSAITFLNDLEKDRRYFAWPQTFSEVKNLKPGQFIAKNILTVIFPIDISSADSNSLIENLVQIVSYGYPMRLSIIPLSSEKDEKSSMWIKAYYSVRQSFGLRTSISFLKNAIEFYNQDGNVQEVIEYLLNQMDLDVELENGKEIFEESKLICKKFNLEANEIFANGLPFKLSQNILEILMKFYSEEFDDFISKDTDTNIYESILLKHSARMERTRIDESFSFKEDNFLSAESISTLLSIKNYFNSKVENEVKISCWLAAEFDRKEIFSFLLSTLKINGPVRTRIFVQNAMTSMPNRIVLATSAILSESPDSIKIVLKFLETFYGNYFGGSVSTLKDIKSDDKIIKKLLKYAADLSVLQKIIKETGFFFSIYGEVSDGSVLFSLNGNSLLFSPSIENSLNLDNLVEDELLNNANRLFNVAQNEHISDLSESVLAFSIFERKFLKLIDQDLSNLISIPNSPFQTNNSPPLSIGDKRDSVFHVQALFNPFNREGQKFSSIMGYFTNSNLFSFELYFVPNLDSKDPKEMRIYRFVTPETKGVPIPVVPVDDEDILMAMSLDLPAAWMAVATYSNSDLDNIRPMKVPHLQASFSLNHIIIEGQAMLGESNEEVATGKIIQLYNSVSGLLEDETSVMANFGYYQLKASPGTWSFRALSSKAESNEDLFEYPIFKGDSLTLTSFGGNFNRLHLKKDTIKLSNIVPLKKQADINVFSLASGLFYERLLRIMIFSVISKKKKEDTVKFWLLGTTLSAQGVLALESLSTELGFEYELMAYNWPSWLNPQTRKHRTIWAYKILFLDVLFPQSLDRIIFIDADQVIRSDLKDLVDLDLKGHVYAMTPFCNDKAEMAQYRFWEHNYWKNHLNGRPYHISALFVVDLLELRRKLVADIIRSQYHLLSQDPNSLSNLDQDLPNNLQHHIPIYSLPQEWLWCDTWCSQSSKSKAKTIDLCNNPKTFESKIDQATRIIPEWKGYDEEVRKILEKGRNEYLKNFKKNMKFEESNHLDL